MIAGPALVLASIAAGAAPHPNSLSRSLVVVDGAAARLELRVQTLTLIEELGEAFDANDDLLLDDEEVAAGRAAIADYLLSHYRLRVGGEEGPLLPGRMVTAETLIVASDPWATRQWLVTTSTFEHDVPIEDLVLEMDLFGVSNPRHRDLALLEWNGEKPVSFVFGPGDHTWPFEPEAARRPGVFGGFLELGVDHILGGYDHLAFLAALLVASRRLRSLIGVVTAFTVAHSITLGLAAFDMVQVPGRFVELAIALSIAYVACDNLLRKEPRSLWIEAFVFGLIHGLGFATFLGEALYGENLVLTALLGFNLGVEAGQLGIVVSLALVLRFLPGSRAGRDEGSGERVWLAPRWCRWGVSGVAAVLGFYWFAERAGFLSWL